MQACHQVIYLNAIHCIKYFVCYFKVVMVVLFCKASVFYNFIFYESPQHAHMFEIAFCFNDLRNVLQINSQSYCNISDISKYQWT